MKNARKSPGQNDHSRANDPLRLYSTPPYQRRTMVCKACGDTVVVSRTEMDLHLQSCRRRVAVESKARKAMGAS